MDNWAFFDGNGNEVTRGYQATEEQARTHAQALANDRGIAIEFQLESDLGGYPEDEIARALAGEVVAPERKPAHVAWLRRAGACANGIAYAARFPTLRAAWDACESAADMVWLACALEECKAGFDPRVVDEDKDEKHEGVIECVEDELIDLSPNKIRDAFTFPDELPEIPWGDK